VATTNWAGNYSYRAGTVHRPETLDELRAIVSRAPRVRALGSRHSFNEIADSDELVAMDSLPADVVFDHEAQTVSLGGGLRYGDLAGTLAAEGVALANLASLPHISVAGAISTGTHGSGDGNGNLATSVAGIVLATSEGELVSAARGDPDFDGMIVGLGALGAVTRVTLDVEPAYEVRQRVFEGLAWDALFENFDAISACGYSVSVFSRWEETADQVWVKSRVSEAAEDIRDDLFGARAATTDRHPIIGIDPVNCTPQLGVPGAWSDRLPHFLMGFTPSSGDEIQSEFIVARRDAVAAIEAVRAIGDEIRPLLQVTELRTIAADRLWMSPQYGQDSLAIHFTWTSDQAAVERVLVDIEDALAPFHPRPHWGKVFLADAATIASRYERLPDFAALAERLDPRGAFRNDWLTAHVLG
jgi:xylitol oxidase